MIVLNHVRRLHRTTERLRHRLAGLVAIHAEHRARSVAARSRKRPSYCLEPDRVRIAAQHEGVRYFGERLPREYFDTRDVSCQRIAVFGFVVAFEADACGLGT